MNGVLLFDPSAPPTHLLELGPRRLFGRQLGAQRRRPLREGRHVLLGARELGAGVRRLRRGLLFPRLRRRPVLTQPPHLLAPVRDLVQQAGAEVPAQRELVGPHLERGGEHLDLPRGPLELPRRPVRPRPRLVALPLEGEDRGPEARVLLEEELTLLPVHQLPLELPHVVGIRRQRRVRLRALLVREREFALLLVCRLFGRRRRLPGSDQVRLRLVGAPRLLVQQGLEARRVRLRRVELAAERVLLRDERRNRVSRGRVRHSQTPSFLSVREVARVRARRCAGAALSDRTRCVGDAGGGARGALDAGGKCEKPRNGPKPVPPLPVHTRSRPTHTRRRRPTPDTQAHHHHHQ
jgi:hypothetical protein